MSVIIGVRVAKKRKTTSTKSSTSTSSSSTSTKPNTTQSTTQTTTNNCNCESRLSALEQKINNINSCTCDKSKITTLENLIANLQTQFNSLSNNQNVMDSNIETIRLYPSAYLCTEQNGSFILLNEQSIVYDILISGSNYTDEEIYNALKFNDTYIKDSVYASYFTVNNKKVNVSKNILNEIELADGSILPLSIIVDLPNLNDTNNYPNGLLFNFIANETTKTINNIKFEIDRYYNGNVDYIGKINIKITYPETIQILTNIDNKFISSKTGKIITITNVVDGIQKEHLKDNTALKDVYKLVAQGATKTYEIIIYWYKTYIPEYN